jgi:DNA topoisomerase-1
LKGRWGPFIKFGTDNIKIPKGTEAEKLTLDECLKIVSETEVKGKKGTAKSKAGTKKKAATKTTTKAKTKTKAKTATKVVKKKK